jgi:hypothetical protein
MIVRKLVYNYNIDSSFKAFIATSSRWRIIFYYEQEVKYGINKKLLLVCLFLCIQSFSDMMLVSKFVAASLADLLLLLLLLT